MMKAVYRCCCGIDVHKKLIVACLKKGSRQELREFGAMTGEIKELARWLKKAGCEMTVSTTNHTWNLVYVDEQWLHVDVAYNDHNNTDSMLLVASYPNHPDQAPEATEFLKELLVPGSTR